MSEQIDFDAIIDEQIARAGQKSLTARKFPRDANTCVTIYFCVLIRS
jgi:hypothetical protein